MYDDTSRATDPAGWLIDMVRLMGREYVFRRYYGLYRGIVVANNDPQDRGRVRVYVPSFGQEGEGDVPLDMWALPIMTGASVGSGGAHGVFWPADVDDQIWVACEDGRMEKQVYLGGWWTRDLTGKDVRDLSHANAQYKGLRTRAGHFLRFSDDPEDRHILLSQGDGEGAPTGTKVDLQADGSVLVKSKSGGLVEISVEGKVTRAVAEDGSIVEVGNDKVLMRNKTGTQLLADGSNVTITAKGTIKLDAALVDIDGRGVKVGKGASQPAVKGASLAQTWQTHTVGTPAGPSVPGSVVPPIVAGKELSTVVTVA